MTEKSRYFVLKQKAVPEVLLKVVEVKRLLASEKGITVQEATEEAGISRSSYYKYRDDIFPFHDETKGKTVTLYAADGGRTGTFVKSPECGGGIPRQYTDHPSEYPDQRDGVPDAQRGGTVFDRRRICHD